MLIERILGLARGYRPGNMTPRHQSLSWFTPQQSITGLHMSEDTALTYSAVWAAVKVLSETVAMLPWRVHRIDGESRFLDPSEPADRLLWRCPNRDMTAFSWREYMVSCALLHGNGYSVIWSDGASRPVELWPIAPNRCDPMRDREGDLVYRCTLPDGRQIDVPSDQMFHLRGPTRDGIVGRSVISLARDSWGLGLAAERFGAAFFGNGMAPSAVIKQASAADQNAPDMSPLAVTNMLNSFEARHRGIHNAGRVAFLDFGLDIQPIGIPQKDAQFIETRQHSVTDVARWFRITPHKIADLTRSTYGNIEHQSIEFVTDSVQPWLERLEQEADTKLLVGVNRVTRFRVSALLRGDAKARSEYYKAMRDLGAMSINDIRSEEDMNPVPGGDLRLVPANMISIDRAARGGGTDQAGAMRAVIAQAHARMAGTEGRSIDAARARGADLVEWAGGYYPRHATKMIDALTTPAIALAQTVGADPGVAEGVVVAHVERWIEASRIDIANGTDTDWDRRVSAHTDRLIGRIVGSCKHA